MRTARTWVCLDCLARQVRLDACVRCGSQRLVDLDTPSGRDDVAAERTLRAERARGLRASPDLLGVVRWRAFPTACALVAALVTMALVLAPKIEFIPGAPLSVWLPWVSLVIAPTIMAAAFGYLVARVAQSKLAARPVALPPLERVDRTRSEAAPSTHVSRSVEGRVRALRTVAAPVSGEAVVAARVVGGEEESMLDDAVCGAFELLDEAGEAIARVEGDHVALDLVFDGDAVAPRSIFDQAFIELRAPDMEPDAATLREAVLREGDRVTVSGPAVEALEATGLRLSRALVVFRGEAAYPVTLRREGVARVRVAVDAEREGDGVGEPVAAAVVASRASRS